MEENVADHVFKIRRNLIDAGCDTVQIEAFLTLEKGHRRSAQYQFLAQHREKLLTELHQQQNKIDCLDYMVYAMQCEDNA